MATDPKLVVALEARLNKFEQQMKEAGVIADRGVKDIEDRFAQANPSFGGSFAGGLAGGFLGALSVRGLERLLEKLVEVNDQIAKIGDTAKLTGIDIDKLQDIRFALVSNSSMNTSQAFSGLEEISKLLNDTRRNENELTKLLDANNIKWKDREGRVIGTNEALKLAAELMRHAATEGDKIDVAKAFGLGKEWVRPLERGAAALEAAGDEATKLGARIDKEAIAKAAEFRQQWEKSLSIWSTSIQSNLSSSMGTIETFIKRMGELFTWIEGIANNILPVLKAINSLNPVSAVVDKLTTGTGTSTKVTVNAPPRNRPETVIPAKEVKESTDAFEKQVESIQKHTSVLEADAEAVGKTVGEHERLRAEATLTDALMKAGIEINDEYAKKMDEVAAAAGRAAQRKAELTSAFNEIQSASKDLGSALSEAFKGGTLNGQKFDEVLKNLTNRLASKSIDKLFDLFFAAPATGGGSIFSNLFKAEGGPVSAGSPYIVGERGRELFVPKVSGTIIPNHVLNSGSRTEVHHNFHMDVTGVTGRKELEEAATSAFRKAIAVSNAQLQDYNRNLPGRITEMQITGV